jgi:hypothetical protein
MAREIVDSRGHSVRNWGTPNGESGAKGRRVEGARSAGVACFTMRREIREGSDARREQRDRSECARSCD